jgi:hypothetical protein
MFERGARRRCVLLEPMLAALCDRRDELATLRRAIGADTLAEAARADHPAPGQTDPLGTAAVTRRRGWQASACGLPRPPSAAAGSPTAVSLAPMRRILAACMAVLPAAVVPAASPAASSGVIYGVCGPSICTVDATTGKKRTLLKGSSSTPYSSVSASRSGAKLAFVRDEGVFRAKRGGKSAERIGTALRQAAPEVNMRPDGGAVAWIDVIQRPVIVCPFPPCGTELERNLIALDADKPAARSVIVAEGLMSAGWLGSSLLRQAFGDGDRPWFVCTVTASAGCVRSVAVDGARWLDDPAGSADGRRVAAVARPGSGGTAGAVSGPIALFDAATGSRLRDLTSGADLHPAFSPDAKRVAFVRGRDLYVVKTGGGPARRLARGVSSPSCAQR